MFGYVRVYQPELKLREMEQYRGVYCSLCQTLGKRYGFAARMTLSYDFTFLSLFIMALADRELSFCQGHCPFNPTKKRLFCEGDGVKALEYAADVAVLLAYHKLSDTVMDERFFKSFAARVMRLFLKRDYNKAVNYRPKEARAACTYMEKQMRIEKDGTVSIDAAAEPTAELLSQLVSEAVSGEADEHTVRRFGYCLGRFIYLADAADDLKKDLVNGGFNPYLTDGSVTQRDEAALEERRQYAAQTLHACAAVCAECYECLPIKRFDGILRNVIYCGMPSVIRQIQKGKREDKRHEKSV